MEENKELVSNIDDIIAATETDGGLGEEIEILDFELAEDGVIDGEDND